MERNVLLKTKSIHEGSSLEDGYRISVMSRHTLNDGVTPDDYITAVTYNQWMKELAPPEILVVAYFKRGLSWEKFEQKYLEFLRKPEVQSHVRKLINLAKTKTVTLLCGESTPEHCHRRLLAEECLRLDADLKVVIA